MALLTLLSFLSASAYRLSSDFLQGYYWGALPVTLTLVAKNEEEGADLEETLSLAKAAWESRIGIELWSLDPTIFYADRPGNIVRWSHEFASETGEDNNTLAITIRHRSGTHLVRTEIILNANRPDLYYDTSGILLPTLIHELGHSLGLGHSEVSAAVMYYSLTYAKKIHEDDVAGMEDLVRQTTERIGQNYQSPQIAQESSKESGKSPLSCGLMALTGDVPGPPPGAVMALGMGIILLLNQILTLLKRRLT
jgi:hypothetical protein